MNPNAQSRKLNGLALIAMIVPLAAGGWLYTYLPSGFSAAGVAILIAFYIVFLGCMIWARRLVDRKDKAHTMLLEKIRMEAARRAAELDALRDISAMMQQGLSADDSLKLILDKAMQVVGVRNGSIFVVDSSEPEGLRLVEAKPPVVFSPDESGKPRRLSFVRSVIESGKAMLIEDIERDPRTMRPNNPKYGAPSFISLPVYQHQKVIAVMNLANKENNHIFTKNDERILTIMLAGIGVELENIALRDEVKNQQAQIKELQAMLAESGLAGGGAV